MSTKLCRLPIPTSHIIYLTSCLIWLALLVTVERKNIFFLRCALVGIAYKRRIAHDIIKPLRLCVSARDQIPPIHPERVTFHNSVIVVKRKILRRRMKDVRRFVEHLGFRYPHRSLGDGHGEVVDLDSVELLDRNLHNAIEV